LAPTVSDKELQLLFKEVLRTFSIEQLEYWAVETGFMKRKTKLKPEHFLLLCSCLGESIGKKSLVQLCAQLCATFDLKLVYCKIKVHSFARNLCRIAA